MNNGFVWFFLVYYNELTIIMYLLEERILFNVLIFAIGGSQL